MGAMTKGEREELKRLARERARVAKADAERRSADLKAAFEQQVISFYEYDSDDVWAAIAEEIQVSLVETNKKIATRAKALGIPIEFTPKVTFTWQARNPRFDIQNSQTELRRAAYKRIEAMERTARHEIDRAALEVASTAHISALSAGNNRREDFRWQLATRSSCLSRPARTAGTW